MAKMMASFGDGYTKTQVISENNSIKYKLSFAAGSEFSTPAKGYFTFQDELLGDQQDGVGLNVREFNPALNTISPKKTFLLTASDTGAGNNSFLEYMDTFTTSNTNLIIITSGGRLYSSPSIDSKFSSYFSTMWPGQWLTSNYPCYYAGLYSPATKRMIAENVTYSDGVLRDEDIRPALEYVYDKPDDIGATGFVYRAIEDFTEYSSANSTIKRWPTTDTAGAPIANYGIKVGDTLFWSFDFFADAGMNTTGQSTRVQIRWLNASGGVVSASDLVESNPANADKWIHHERHVTVPAGTVNFTVLAAKNPNTTSTGVGGVRDMVFVKTSRKLEPFTSPAAIGVNGIRMNNAVSGSDPELLILPAVEVDSSGKPLPGEDVSGNIYSSDWREFEKNI
jgi:hypothetical protein